MNDQTTISDRQTLDVDILCVGFGPATAGFLSTLTKGMMDENGMPRFESKSMPGMPPQVMCYERADDTGFGVSGVVTRGKGIRASWPDLDVSQIPMACPVTEERVLYLLDPVGASRRPTLLKLADGMIRTFKWMLPYNKQAFRLPYLPPFLRKHDGWVMSLGQFNQWLSGNLMGTGLVQIWPGTPVGEPLMDGDNKVTGVRLVDQGTTPDGKPDATYMPGMDIHAELTVLGDGPVGPVGRMIDDKVGVPEGNHQRDWAVGMKAVVDLPPDCQLKPGTVLHTFGYPEPEIFGFMYVLPDNVASLGIFVPSWFDNPVRTSYRYLQHWMQHPYLWQYLQGGTMRSWGAKSLQESGRRGEPHLVGNGYARIGEGSGSTNVLTGSGVDEAWTTGVQLAEGVLELMAEGKPFTRENLEAAYVQRRRQSWVDRESRAAAKARDGFQKGFILGMIGMGLAGMTGGRLNVPGKAARPQDRIPRIEDYYKGILSAEEVEQIRQECRQKNVPLHDALMERAGWPAIQYDGQLLVSQQDALLLGGKVQAPAGYANHVVFQHPELCRDCREQVCVEACSGQAIAPGEQGWPVFDRDKCVHCGACLWNCSKSLPGNPEKTNIMFRAGAGGLHSAEN